MLRVYLRPLEENDVTDDYIEWFSDEDVTAFLESRNLTRESVIEYIKRGKDTGEYYMYAICLTENNKHIGNMKVGPINKKHSLSDLVCVIGDKEQWGKGLATEAIKLGNKVAFEAHNMRKLTGGMYEKNIGSIQAYTRAGWVIEGKLQGHYMIDGKFQDKILVSCFNPCYVGE